MLTKKCKAFLSLRSSKLRRSGYINEKMQGIFESKMVNFKVVLLEENSL